MSRSLFPQYFFRPQPLKAMFFTFEAMAIALRFPVWFLQAVHPAMRPRRSWSLRRTMRLKLIKRLMHWSYYVGRLNMGTASTYKELRLENGVEGEWISPVPEDLVQGDIRDFADVAKVKPIAIPGYWFTKKKNSGEEDAATKTTPVDAMAHDGERLVLFFHGGGYVSMSAHSNSPPSNIPRGILEHAKDITRLLSVEYRLSSTHPNEEDGPFPSALLDALSGYYHLIQRGFAPANIIVAGDSAGGNLALALTRYLVEQEDCIQGLPAPPGRLLLFSPWVDLWDLDGDKAESSLRAFANSDYLSAGGNVGYPQKAFTGPHGVKMAQKSRFISPAGLYPIVANGVKFSGFPQTFISVGGAELLYDQILRLKDRMVRDLGEEKVTLLCAPDGVHDFVVFEWFEPERSETLRAIAEWLK